MPKYAAADAKAYARQHLRGVWAATLTPFRDDLSLDEDGYRRNVHHWTRDLGIAGLFVCGKQGEFFSMSIEERKRTFEIAAEATAGVAGTVMSCSDEHPDTVIELAKHAQAVGADYVVVHTPVWYFGAGTDEAIYKYYEHIASQIDIGLVLWNQPPDCGYTLSPEMCTRLADIPNVVGIKYSVPRETYSQLTRMAKDKLIVSCSSEEEWLDNIIELNWQVYLCSSPPYTMQTKNDRRMHDYTQLAMQGKHVEARKVRDSLEPVRHAIKTSRPHGKPAAQQKYWQELLGQAGGPVRFPLLNLTADEKAKIRDAFDACGLGKQPAARAA
jgi:4-hydroxy-tetrahydrodipicolinate synthase